MPFGCPPNRWSFLVVAACLVWAAAPARAGADDAMKLPEYVRSSGEVAGAIKCVGSDTMNNLVALWAEGFNSNCVLHRPIRAVENG